MQRILGWKPRLGIVIGVVLTTAVMLSAVAVFTITIVNYRSTVLGVSHSLMDQLAAHAHERVQRFFQPPRDALGALHARLDDGLTPPDDIPAVEAEFFALMRAFDEVSQLSYGDADGRFLMTRRIPDGSISTKLITIDGGVRRVHWKHRDPGARVTQVARVVEDPDDVYDPRARPWFQGARDAHGLFLSEVYVFWSDRQPGVTYALPLFAGERLQGVLSVDINIKDIASFLRRLPLADSGRALIIDARARIIASPDPNDALDDDDGDASTPPTLRPLTQSTDEAFARLAREAAFKSLLSARSASAQPLVFEVDDETFIGVVRPVHLEPGRDWLIVLVVPEDELLSDLKATSLKTLLVAGFFVLLSLLFAFVLARWINRSLSVLAGQSERIRRLDFEDSIDASRAPPFREVEEVMQAFGRMKVGLRGFQRYLPVELVRHLLQQNQEPVLGGELREVTIYFSDIADFTTLSEATAPMQMATLLGGYLAAMSDEIRAHDGTVVQYVGDEIMAFWNAPKDVDDHPALACHAALACQRVAERLRDEGSPMLETRVGVHTATVAVGHFGAPNRLYYGAIGDGVNLTSRLEGANKFYGTHIIISDETERRVRGRFVTRRLDRVVVKGRVNPSPIYELLGAEGDVDEARRDRARRYEEGLDLYFERRWQDAIAQLQPLADELAAKNIITRCHIFAQNSPPEDWDGTYTMTAK